MGLILLVFMFTGASAQNYYLKSGGSVTNLLDWSPNANGIGGTAPTTFAGTGRTFNIRNNTTVIATGPWVVTNFTVGDGTTACDFSDGGFTLTVAGNIVVNNKGTFTILEASTPSLTTLNAGSTVVYGASGNQTVDNVTFSNLTLSGSGTKSATNSLTVTLALTINSGVTFALTTRTLSGVGSTAGTGGILTTTSNAAAIPAGKNWAFEVQYTAAGTQTVASGTYTGGLTISGSGTKSMTNNSTFSVPGALTINSPTTFNLNASTLSALGSAAGDGILLTSTDTTPLPNGITWLFAVNYNGATQNVASGTFSGDLTIAAGTKTVSGALSVAGTLTVTGTLAMGTNQLTTAGTLITATTGTAGKLTTANTSATAPLPTGQTWAFEVDYTSTSAQTVVAGTYNGDLNVGGTGSTNIAGGNITMASGTTLTVGATFDMGTYALASSGTITEAGNTGTIKTSNTSSAPLPVGSTWASKVTYTTPGQTISGGTYSTTPLTIPSSGTSLVNGDLTYSGALAIPTGLTLDMQGNDLSVNSVSGTGQLKTASTSTTPLTLATGSWLCQVEYYGTTQSVSGGTYNAGLILDAGTKTAVGAVTLGNTSDLTINGTLNMSTFLIALGTSTNLLGTGTLQTSNTTATPLPSGKTWPYNVVYAGGSVSVMTGTYSQNLTLNSSANNTKKATGNITVGGDFIFALANSTNCHFDLNTGATTYILTINGNFNATLGDFDFNNGNGNASVINLKGNFSNTAANIQTSTANGTNGTVNFTGPSTAAAPQTFSNTSNSNITWVNFTVANNAALQLNSIMPLERESTAGFQGTLTVSSGGILNMQGFNTTAVDNDSQGGTCNVNINAGGTVMTSHANGIPGSFPVANTTTKFDSGAIYEFDGTGVTGTFTTTSATTPNTVGGLTVNSTAKVTASQSFIVTNALTLTNGTLNMGSTFTLAGIASNSGTGTLETQVLTGAIPAIAWNVGVLYDATGPTATQNVIAAPSYTNLSFASTAIKKFPTGNFKVNGDWSSTGGKVDLTTNTVAMDFAGTGAQSLSEAGSDAGTGVSFKTVKFSGSGTKTMSGAGKFLVATNGTLTMAGSATLAANGLLWLKSNATSTAAIDVIPSGCGITGDVYAERYMIGNNTNAGRGYRLMTSTTHDGITNTYNIFNLKQNMYITGTAAHEAASLDPNDLYFDPSPNHGATIYHYYEPTAGIQSPTNDVVAISTPLNYDEFKIGEGMFLYYRGSRGANMFNPTTSVADNTAVVFKGTVNQGSYPPFSLSYTNSGTPGNDGFNLVGNPYPSTIDIAGTGITYSSGLTNFIYLLDPVTKAYCTIDRTNPVLGKTGNADRYIAAGQGFFVQATATGSSITFTENAKAITQQPTGGKLLMSLGGAPITYAPQAIKLKMVNPADSTAADDIVIMFNSGAKDGFDRIEDAYDMGGTGTTFLSSFSSDNVKLAINAMPSITKGTKIRLSVNSTLAGTFNLKAGSLSTLDSRFAPLLVDNYKADTIKLLKTDTYTFTIDRGIAATYNDNRFQLIFSEKTPQVNSLLLFSANQVRSHIDVNWKTGPDPVSVTFTVEKSLDKTNFFGLGLLPSNGSTTTYTYADNNPVTGDNYYRLKQTDIYGLVTYSDIVDVKYAAPTAPDLTVKPFTVYPQPVLSALNVALNQSYTGDIKVRVLDMFGIEINANATFKGAGYSMDVSKLRTGSYIVELSTTDKVIGRSVFIKL